MDKDPRLPVRSRRNALDAHRAGPPAWPMLDGHREEDIDWRRWASVLWRRKWWVLAATVLGTGTAGFVARGYEATYQTEALVWTEPPTDKLALPIEVSSVFATAGMIELFTSYAVLDGVVADLKLYVLPEDEADRPLFQNFQRSDSAVSDLYRLVVRPDGRYFLHDGEDQVIQLASPGDTIGLPRGFRWMPPAGSLEPGDEIAFTLLHPQAAANQLRGSLEVMVMDQTSNFLHVVHRGRDRQFVAVVLNSVLDHFQRVATELKRQEITKLRATLEEQAAAAKARLDTASSELQRFRVGTITLPEDRRQQLILPPDGQGTPQLSPGDPVFDRYATLQVARDSIRRDLESLREVLAGLQRTGNVDAIKLEAIPSVQATSALRASLEELLEKDVEHRNLLYRYTPEHPAVKRLAGDIQTLKGQTIPSQVRALIDQLESRQVAFNSEGKTLSTEIQRIPPRTIEGERLQREFMLAEQLYSGLQNRYKEAQVAELATDPNVRIVDRALPGSGPIDARARLAVIVGFILSFGLAIAGVIAYERFVERSIQYPDQVVQGLGLPILAVVPNLRLPARGRRSAATLAKTSSDARVVESFRGLRTRLTHGFGIQYPAAIAITSPAMGDGKSLVAANLALSFADPTRCTVLIDADLRRGSLHRLFHTSSSPGLADYLRGKVDAAAILRETGTPGLRFIPAGTRADDAPDLLEGGRLPELIAQLKEGAHIILIDTPPLVAGVDPILIAEHADAAVAVLRAGQTDLEMARARLDAYEQMIGVPILGAVLNDVETEGAYRYYAYSYEAYPEENR